MPFSRDTRAVIYQRAKMVSTSGRSAPRRMSIAMAMNGSIIRWRTKVRAKPEIPPHDRGPDCQNLFSVGVNISP